ncbi:MAG: cytochrome c biogenesis protein CcdA [Patescibacteria group bacterium]
MPKIFSPIITLSFMALTLFGAAPAQANEVVCKTGGVLSLNLTPWAVACGAALDAINPCEFAILILLMASLLLNDENRKKALQTGLSFVGAVFVAYFLMGVGLLEFLRVYTLSISSYFYYFIGGLAIILGLFNIKDYFWYGGGGFLMEVPQSWRPKMKGLILKITTPLGAFLTGLLVSLFLLPCTSGPYVVILGMLASKTTLAQALIYLIFYNLIFIAPMLAIVLAIYWGLSPEKAEVWRKQKLRLLHLIAGVVLVALGVAILGGWI